MNTYTKQQHNTNVRKNVNKVKSGTQTALNKRLVYQHVCS